MLELRFLFSFVGVRAQEDGHVFIFMANAIRRLAVTAFSYSRKMRKKKKLESCLLSVVVVGCGPWISNHCGTSRLMHL